MKTSILFFMSFYLNLTIHDAWSEPTIKVGLIGLDTSHAPAFTKILNDSSHRHHLPGARIVAAFPGGSPDVQASITRVEKFTQEVADYQVEIVESLSDLLSKVDAVILTSVDGRVHLEQVKPVIAAGKPVYIDKPMAASLADVKEIFRLANEAKVPCFSASSLRFFPELRQALRDTSLGKIIGCDAFSPASLEAHHPDLMWYGIHGVEILFAAMGAACKSVSRTFAPGTDVVVGLWENGRIGTFRGIRDGQGHYGATLFFQNGVRFVEPNTSLLYVHLMIEILNFFRTGLPPVPQEETIAMFVFMEGAETSTAQNGIRVFFD